MAIEDAENKQAAVKLRPERVVNELNGITLIEVFKHYPDGSSELAGYYVYGGMGDSSILHESHASGSAEFHRRISGGS